MSYQDLLNAVAQVVGGSQPSAAQVAAAHTDAAIPAALQPYWYSGLDTGDASGVAGLVGCFSLPTEQIHDSPVGLVLPSGWNPTQVLQTQGAKYREDEIRVRVMTGHADLTTQMAQLVNFADSVPTAFDHAMSLFGQANGVDCSSGHFLEVEWPTATVYLALEFTVKVQRAVAVTYAN